MSLWRCLWCSDYATKRGALPVGELQNAGGFAWPLQDELIADAGLVILILESWADGAAE